MVSPFSSPDPSPFIKAADTPGIGNISLPFKNSKKILHLVDNSLYCLYDIDLIDIREENMNKADLVNALKNENGFTRQQAEKIVDIFFNTMADALENGERVEIRGFGSIFVKDYKSYTGRNPKTGEPVKVKPKKLPFFRCGKELKERVDVA
jgi:integration host factor subunit beta